MELDREGGRGGSTRGVVELVTQVEFAPVGPGMYGCCCVSILCSVSRTRNSSSRISSSSLSASFASRTEETVVSFRMVAL